MIQRLLPAIFLCLLFVTFASGQLPTGHWEGEYQDQPVHFSILPDSLAVIDFWHGPFHTVIQRVTADSLFLGWINPASVSIGNDGGFAITGRREIGEVMDFAFTHSDSLLVLSSGTQRLRLRPVPPPDPQSATTFLRLRGNRMAAVTLPTISEAAEDHLSSPPVNAAILLLGVPKGGYKELLGADHRMFSDSDFLEGGDIPLYLESYKVKRGGEALSVILLADADTPVSMVSEVLAAISNNAATIAIYLACSLDEDGATPDRLRLLPLDDSSLRGESATTLRAALRTK